MLKFSIHKVIKKDYEIHLKTSYVTERQLFRGILSNVKNSHSLVWNVLRIHANSSHAVKKCEY